MHMMVYCMGAGCSYCGVRSFSRECCRCDVTPLSCNRTEDPDYETYVIAFLPTLKYWKRISYVVLRLINYFHMI
jgi:hypothetical protein